jgi:hypothetical protein
MVVDWLIVLECTYYDERNSDNDIIVISRFPYIGSSFLGFNMVTTWNVFLFVPMIQEKEL